MAAPMFVVMVDSVPGGEWFSPSDAFPEAVFTTREKAERYRKLIPAQTSVVELAVNPKEPTRWT